MRANRRRDTLPEKQLRSALHRLGCRFRCNYRIQVSDTRACPDVVFTRRKIAVFVDGCYWHGCPEHGSMPVSNRDYWRAKISGNRARDAKTDTALRIAGWSVVRVWEHEDAEVAAREIATIVRNHC
jgi:DNA mismatch endonuclease, patch repair protein